MSPEYTMDGSFSVKSDVFSFGIVVLEIVSGIRNTGFYQSKEALNLLGYVRISLLQSSCFYSKLLLP